MWILALLAVATLAVLIGRFTALRGAGADVNGLLTALRNALVVKRTVGDGIRLCEQTGGPVAAVLKAGLLKAGQPREDIERAAANADLVERGRLERGLPVLAAVASTAPLLGVLGAVAGVAGTTTLSPGSLAPIAAGVALAIPARLGLIYFRSRIDRFERGVATSRNVLLETLAEMERGGASTSAR